MNEIFDCDGEDDILILTLSALIKLLTENQQGHHSDDFLIIDETVNAEDINIDIDIFTDEDATEELSDRENEGPNEVAAHNADQIK